MLITMTYCMQLVIRFQCEEEANWNHYQKFEICKLILIKLELRLVANLRNKESLKKFNICKSYQLN